MDLLISVVTPFYNASNTISIAINSLLDQTYENWELLLVNDGSTDNPSRILELFQDPRIRYFRFDINQGRGAARQYALEQSHGKYLCFLDADDWIYPRKLEIQLDILESNPQISLLSSGMAVVDNNDQLIGVRDFTYGPDPLVIHPPMKKPSPPRINFASSMIRMDVAKKAHFDSSLRKSEDADFLLQILLAHSYGFQNDILYVYRELLSVEKKDVLAGYQSRIQVYRKYLESFPLISRKIILESIGKIMIYRIAFSLGLGTKLIQNRSRKPFLREQTEFSNYWGILQSHLLNN